MPKPLSQKKLKKVAEMNRERSERQLADRLKALETPRPEKQRRNKKDKKSTTAWRPLP